MFYLRFYKNPVSLGCSRFSSLALSHIDHLLIGWADDVSGCM